MILVESWCTKELNSRKVRRFRAKRHTPQSKSGTFWLPSTCAFQSCATVQPVDKGASPAPVLISGNKTLRMAMI